MTDQEPRVCVRCGGPMEENTISACVKCCREIGKIKAPPWAESGCSVSPDDQEPRAPEIRVGGMTLEEWREIADGAPDSLLHQLLDEVERLRKELSNLGYRYEDALAELARERERD